MSEVCRLPDCGRPVDARGLCHTHYERWRRTGTTADPVKELSDPAVRFAAKVRVETGGCHIWTGSQDDRGYGLFRVNRRRVVRAHIFAYEQAHGPVPDGLELDHFACDRTSCVNPNHVRPATTRENTLRSQNACALNARKTHCIKGHEFTPENTARNARGHRRCRACTAARGKARRASWVTKTA